MPRFTLGRILATPGAIEAISEAEMVKALRRHATGDWGLVDAEDKAANDAALADGSRLLSVYEHNGIRFWIVTEAERDATTFLLPSEY